MVDSGSVFGDATGGRASAEPMNAASGPQSAERNDISRTGTILICLPCPCLTCPSQRSAIGARVWGNHVAHRTH